MKQIADAITFAIYAWVGEKVYAALLATVVVVVLLWSFRVMMRGLGM